MLSSAAIPFRPTPIGGQPGLDAPTDPAFSALSFPTLRAVAGAGDEEAARAQGHAAGYAAGLRAAANDVAATIAGLEADHDAVVWQANAQLERSVALLTAATRALDARTEPVLREAEDTLLATALDLAEAIIGHQLSDGPSAARLALRRALDPATPTRPNSVRMNPADLALLEPDILTDAGVQFLADPGIARGDAITDFPDGFVDARIGTAFARARAALLGGAR